MSSRLELMDPEYFTNGDNITSRHTLGEASPSGGSRHASGQEQIWDSENVFRELFRAADITLGYQLFYETRRVDPDVGLILRSDHFY